MTTYIKTSKGAREAGAHASELDSDLLRVLISVDGNHSVDVLRKQSDYLSAEEFDEAIDALVVAGYIRDSAQTSDGGADQSTLSGVETLRKAQALRAKIRARREGTEHSAPVAGEMGRHSEAQVGSDDEQRLAREATARVRQEAEEKARQVAEEEARREAAKRARQAAEEQARQEALEQERLDSAKEAKRISEEEAEAHARWMAEQNAWREAEEKLKRDEEEAARDRASVRAGKRTRMAAPDMVRKWGKALAFGVLALVAGGLAAIHLISFDGQIPQFEKSLAGQFQQPVKIKSLRLGLVPQSYVGLEGVSIGGDGQIRASRIKLVGGLGNLFSDKKEFRSIELDSPVLTEEGLGWLLFGQSTVRNMVFGQVSALNATLESKNVNFPAFDAKLQSDGEGAWKAIVIESQDKNLSLELTPKGRSVQVDVKAKSFKVPFGSTLTLDEMVASGIADRGGLVLAEFKGFAYGGILSGNASLKWGAHWTLEGELNVKQVDTARLIPQLLDGARLAGKAAFILHAPEATKLFAAPRMEGSFNIPRGTLLGADLGSLLQGGGARGDTKFADLAGNFSHDRGATQFRQVSLSQGSMTAAGMFDVDAEQNVRGRFAADLKLAAESRRANLTLSGTLKKLEWRR